MRLTELLFLNVFGFVHKYSLKLYAGECKSCRPFVLAYTYTTASAKGHEIMRTRGKGRSRLSVAGADRYSSQLRVYFQYPPIGGRGSQARFCFLGLVWCSAKRCHFVASFTSWNNRRETRENCQLQLLISKRSIVVEQKPKELREFWCFC